VSRGTERVREVAKQAALEFVSNLSLESCAPARFVGVVKTLQKSHEAVDLIEVIG
jgi:hypothetical protein